MLRKLVPARKLGFASALFYLLLLYIVAALVWWFVSLMRQSHQMTNYKLEELKADDPTYLTKVQQITDEQHRATAKYIGEGTVFFSLIMVGAFFVYRAVRREFKLAEQQHNFMMAITHELKTPIAVAKLNLETLQKHKLDEEKQQKIIAMTLQETNRLNTLANNILVSAQMDEKAFHTSKEELNLSDLARRSVEEYRTRFPGKNWNISVEEDLSLAGDPLLLQILINNLIDNAVKYTGKDGEIGFTIQRKRNMILVSVTDNGVGIPDNEKQRIFDRFYRIGDEKVRKTKGTGLGLYLCKRIAFEHNARIVVTDNLPTGANFTIQFHV